MALNPNIILAGQQPDIMGGMAQATELAARHGDINRTNALNRLLQSSGDKIAAGDQQALNRLAQFDPQASLGIQQTRQGMAQSEERMQMARDQAKRAAAEWARKASAEEAAAAAAKIEAALQGATQAETREQWDAQMDRHGLDKDVYSWDNRAIVLAEGLGAVEALKAVKVGDDVPGGSEAPAAFQALAMRAEAAGLKPGTPEYQEFMATGGPKKGTRLTVDPETGAVTFEDGVGVGANNPKLTVEQGKNTGFAIRLRESNEILNGLEAEGTDLGARLAKNIPIMGNYLQSPEYRRYDQAKRDFVNAVLRRESGAVISDQEFANAEVQYFPQPGDDPETIAQKRRNREAAIAGIEISAGPGLSDSRVQERATKQPDGPVRLPAEGADAAYDALPSGATFIAPDGTTRRKP